MKKKFCVLLVLVLVCVSMTGITASAHGRRGGTRYNNSRSYSYPQCPVDDCNLTYTHLHNNTYYCGHSLYDGHDHHQICAENGCTYVGVHNHDGEYFFPCYGAGYGGGYGCGRRGGRRW